MGVNEVGVKNVPREFSVLKNIKSENFHKIFFEVVTMKIFI